MGAGCVMGMGASSKADAVPEMACLPYTWVTAGQELDQLPRTPPPTSNDLKMYTIVGVVWPPCNQLPPLPWQC